MTAGGLEGLSEAEVERLATRLSANKNPNALSLERVDGLFCALIASPTMFGPSGYLPVILGGEPGTDDIPGREWARGFMRGTRLAPTGWKRLFSDDREGLPVTIALVAGEVDPHWPKEPLTKEKSDELLEWMFAGAARAYRFFAADRRESAGSGSSFEDDYSETYVRPERKVGRNEPCPCGSGKKFKKCCGAADLGPLH